MREKSIKSDGMNNVSGMIITYIGSHNLTYSGNRITHIGPHNLIYSGNKLTHVGSDNVMYSSINDATDYVKY